MTVKRFTVPKNYRCVQDNLTKEHYLCEDKTEAINLAYLLNELAEENEQLKQSNEDAIHILKREFDFATEQRQKHLDEPVVVNAYDIIRFDMRKALDKLGGLE